MFGRLSLRCGKVLEPCWRLTTRSDKSSIGAVLPVRQYTTGLEEVFERGTLKPLDSRKTFLVDSYKHLMEASPVVVFLHYNNLLKHEDHHYRAQIKQLGGRLTILRNNLFKVYLKNAHLKDPCVPIKSKDQNRTHPLLPLFKGPTAAITFQDTNPKDVANVLRLLERAQDKLFVVGAKVETESYDLAQLHQYKTLPGKPALQGQLLGLLHTLSGAGLVKTLESASQSLYLTLSSHHDNSAQEKDS